MSGGSHIVAVGPGETRPEPQAETSSEAEEVLSLDEEWEEAPAPPPRRFGWAMPTLAVLAILGWSGFFAFVHQREMLAGATPQQWSEWITAWAVPVLLVVALWLLAMRTSSREASRFGDAARLLSQESLQLEQRMVTVNRELSLARDFIAAQSRDLEALGRVASERLSKNADRLAGLIVENGAQIDSIANVSTTALENMDKLRGDLPVIANSARDVTSQIGNAGRTAHTQLDGLVSGFHRLNEFGEASERQVQSLRVKVDSALAAFEAQAAKLDEIATARFEALDERSQAFKADLDSREVEALAAIRRRAEELSKDLAESWTNFDEKGTAALDSLRGRISSMQGESDAFVAAVREGEGEALEKWGAAIEELRERLAEALNKIAQIDASILDKTRERLNALGEEAQLVDSAMEERVVRFMEGIETRRSEHEARETREMTSLDQRLAYLDAAIAERHEQHVVHVTELTGKGEALAAKLDALGKQVETITEQGSEASGELTESIEQLSQKLASNQNALQSIDSAIAELTDASVRLLELIQAGSRHSREELPKALESAQHRLDGFEEQTRAVGIVLGEAGEKGRELSDYVLAARRDGKATLEDIDRLHQRLSERQDAQAGKFEELRASLASLADESVVLSERAQSELSEGVEKLQNALREAVAELEGGSTKAVEALAERIGAESAEAIDQALRMRTTEAITQLEQSAVHASGVSREAARQLRDQLARVDELAGNLENRVAQARERAEEHVDNDFARRVALITESINSNAIDISKALSNDVTDTAWASYLRGDRGIFTRRAVRLLDNSEAREIAEIYDRDHDFREHVSRYIHDFEAMLRTMLSTRDGNALGVTLLSSDMGKLYVALAQAIERLRD